ncbi:MAG TPA: ABC transporter permease, partial [Vicinamibacterales bacterium]|nr:ABC transporter permease [Vicinamibacterales bacterium]
MSSVLQDARYAVRGMRRDLSFFAVAVLIIGVGIGASTSIFSVVNALLLRGLPFQEPERLVWVANTGKGSGLSAVTSRASALRDWRRLNQSFAGLTGYFAFFDYEGYNLVGSGEPERCVGVRVVQDFLTVLGIQPRLGRNFVPEEAVWNGRRAAILTDGFWKRRFGGDPAIVGRSITLDEHPTEIVGVLPAAFDFASIFSPTSRVDFLLPFPIGRESDRMGNTLAIIGRLRPGVSVERAQAELASITERLKEDDPSLRGNWGARVTALEDHITGRYRRPLAVLAAAVLVVLLIACANLSNLLLARGASRRTELALRSALGAGRARLVGQLLVESLLLSLCGAALGLALAVAVTRGIA